MDKVIWGAIIVIVVVALLSGGSEEDAAARELGFESAADMAEAGAAGFSDADLWADHQLALAAAEEAERVQKGFHCLSHWDGSHTELRRAVKERMRDPDSFEHIETRITPVSDEGTHTLMMEYRARNGFGGMTVGSALAIVQSDDCSYELLTVE